jgi:hypothetical protein
MPYRVTKMLSPRPAAISSAMNEFGQCSGKNALIRFRTLLARPAIAWAASMLVPGAFQPASRRAQ